MWTTTTVRDGISGVKFYEHNGDAQLAKDLGLTTVENWRRTKNDYIHLGTVKEEPRNDAHPLWEVEVAQATLPAQFFRFTIHRSRWIRDQEYEIQSFVLTTGSGGLVDYWPTAKLIAEDMLDIERL